MSKSEKWSDLVVRLGSALAMVLVGLWAIWIGSHVFHIFVAVVCRFDGLGTGAHGGTAQRANLAHAIGLRQRACDPHRLVHPERFRPAVVDRACNGRIWAIGEKPHRIHGLYGDGVAGRIWHDFGA